MKILALNGSHNNDGNTAYLLNKILGYFRKEDTEIVNVYEAVSDAKLPFCINCSTPCSKQCQKGTKLEELLEKVNEFIGKIKTNGQLDAICEKYFQGGGNRIREKGIRVESLAMIESMTDDSLTFVEKI